MIHSTFSLLSNKKRSGELVSHVTMTVASIGVEVCSRFAVVTIPEDVLVETTFKASHLSELY